MVVHKLTDISAMQIDSLNGMMGLKVINGDNVSLPFSEEEMGKTLSLDADFVRSTAERLKGFSLVDENGRSRVLFSSDAKELVSFGKEDLIYYTEMARDANLLLLANLKDSAKLSEILGEDTQKILKDCRRIGAISHALEYKLQGPDRQLSMLRQMYYEDCNEVPETLEILREEQRIAAAEQKEKAFLSDRV